MVGNMIQMATDDSKYVYETFEKLAAIYGPLFMFRNGSVKTGRQVQKVRAATF